MEALLIKYSYALLFLGVAIEGEGFLLVAAFLAHQGMLDFATVLVVAIAANFFSDQIYYAIARARGLAWLEARFGRHRQYNQAVGWMKRHSNWVLLISRYVFGFRIIIPAGCGALGMPFLRFTLINMVSGIIWAVPEVGENRSWLTRQTPLLSKRSATLYPQGLSAQALQGTGAGISGYSRGSRASSFRHKGWSGSAMA